MRKTSEEIQELCEKFGTDILWSWSRMNCVHNSLYEYYLKHILHIKPDKNNSIYKVTGGMSHDIIERFYSNQITHEQMLPEFENAWMTAFTMADLKFDRLDEEKNARIAKKYHYDLSSFFNNHKRIPYTVILEQFVTAKVGEEYFQGYIDCCFKNSDDCFVILDWKTSSLYVGEKAKNECGQLVLYAMALHQKNIPYEQIKIGWNFLKYYSVTVEAKNGNKKVRNIERCELGDKLQASVKTWLKHFGYETEMLFYLNQLLETNDISVLPVEVQEKFELNDCIVYVPLTEELIQYWENYIIDTTKLIREKEKEYELTNDESIWYEDEETVKKQSYYFANLCDYSSLLHKPYAKYLQQLEEDKDDSIFGSQTSNMYAEDDLSWLNNI